MKHLNLSTYVSITLTVVALTLSSLTQAQVRAQKIGNNPTIIDANAALEIESTNKGLLFPRVELTATTSPSPLTADVRGMLVYNTASAGDVTPGLYYNDGADWVPVLSGTFDGNHVVGAVSGTKPDATPAAPTAANLPASPIDGDTVTEVYDDFIVSYSYDGAAWTSVEYSKALDGNQFFETVATVKPDTTPAAPGNATGNEIAGDTHTVIYNDFIVNYSYDGADWTSVEYGKALDGNQFFETVATVKPDTTPAAPGNATGNEIAGDTHTVIYNDFIVNYSYDGAAWTSVEYSKALDGNHSFSAVATAKPATTPTTPDATSVPTPPTTPIAGDTHTVKYADYVVNYSHNGTAWTVATEYVVAGNDWSILGNTETSPATNFLGTTDDQSLVIRTNNNERIRVEAGGTTADDGNVGIGVTDPSSKLHIGGSTAIPQTSTATTLDNTHHVVKVDTSAADVTITLPAAAAVPGRTYIVIKTDASANKLIFSVAIQTNGNITFTEANVPGDYHLQSDGTNWVHIN